MLQESCYCSKKRAWAILTRFVPVVKFVKMYKWGYIIGDFLSGLTATFIHFPQGLAFAVLAGLKPVYGLYTTFFPLLIYLLLGTSPHVSFGTNALLALITQTIVQREASVFKWTNLTNLTLPSQINESNSLYLNYSHTKLPLQMEDELLHLQVGAAMTATLITGFILTGLGVCRLGFLTRFISASFVGGFTTAAAIHVASSQIPKMLGIVVVPQPGAGRVVKIYIDLFTKIESTIFSELIISSLAMIILLVVKIHINERYKDRMKIPIPIDFILVIVGTISSHFGEFETKFNVKTVGDIPAGFPAPSIPSIDSASRMIQDCVVLAVLSLAINISFAKLTAKEHGIIIDANQELVAYGLCNIGSSFFSCFPVATDASRTMILSTLGSKTTLNAIPTIVITWLIIQWIGTLFNSLPVAILAAVIIAAMKNVFLQFGHLPRLWKINKFDCIIWVITCSVSVLVNLDYGILAGVGFSILSVIIQNQLASGRIIAYSDQDNTFVDPKERVHVYEIETVKIFQFQAPIHFANADIFKNLLYKKVADPRKLNKRKENCFTDVEKNDKQANGKPNAILKHIILDFQMVSHVDLTSIDILCQIIKEYKKADINIYFVKSSEKISKTLTAANFFDNFPKEHFLFDIADAVYFIKVVCADHVNVKNIKSGESTKL